MSSSTLRLDEPWVSLWAGQDPFVAVEALTGQVFRQLEGRRTLRTEIAGRGYFVKIHRGIGWPEILKNLVSLRLPVLGAENEWRAIERLRGLGVDTMRAVAFGRRGDNPARQQSFIVTEELSPTISLEDYARDWVQRPPEVLFKRALIARVAETARHMHAGGVNHRDFYLCHFLLHLDPSPTAERFRLSLIDLHRAQLRRRTPRRWRDKDLAALYFSALAIGLTRRDLLRFLAAYFARPLRRVLSEEAPLLVHLTAEAQRLQDRFARKSAAGEMA
ncbi:MAG: lipopolysaccharide core heptose(I) kinase RfaP [Candidatus Accumulibacter sp. UW26]|jgi:heptose I phosphotransferase